MGKIIKKVALTFFLILPILACLFLGVGIYYLEEDLYKLQNSNEEMVQKLNDVTDMTRAIWNERAFEKEMKENIAYYLPDGFYSTVHYTGLTPLDLEMGQARVTFMHRYKNYSVDFSYSYNQKGWDIERISEVHQLE